MKDWEEEYGRKLISAEEAAKFVKLGDYIIGEKLKPKTGSSPIVPKSFL